MNTKNTNNLETLFNIVRDGAFRLRINNPKADGRQFWQFIKNKCSIIEYNTHNPWKFRAYIHIKETTELQHFIAQHFNIPHHNRHPTLPKILQIALNIGQFLALAPEYEIEGYDYFKNNLHLLSTYVHKEDITILSTLIPNDMIKDILHYINTYN